MAMVKKGFSVSDQQELHENEVVKEINLIRTKLIAAEMGGFTDQSSDSIFKEIKDGLGRDTLQTQQRS